MAKSQVDLERISKVLQDDLQTGTPEPDKWLEALTRQLYGNLKQEREPTNKRRRKPKQKE